MNWLLSSIGRALLWWSAKKLLTGPGSFAWLAYDLSSQADGPREKRRGEVVVLWKFRRYEDWLCSSYLVAASWCQAFWCFFDVTREWNNGNYGWCVFVDPCQHCERVVAVVFTARWPLLSIPEPFCRQFEQFRCDGEVVGQPCCWLKRGAATQTVRHWTGSLIAPGFTSRLQKNLAA